MTDTDEVWFVSGTDAELARLDMQHEVWRRTFGGRQVFALTDLSRDDKKRVLDSACANGKRVLELREACLRSCNDHMQYLGCDIDKAKFPATSPAWVEFHQQSFTDPWPSAWHGTFDFVHQRLALAGGGTTPIAETIKNFSTLLKPGGWLQIVEFDTSPSDDDLPSWSLFRRPLNGVIVAKGVHEYFATTVKGAMEEAGLKAVEEEATRVPHGKAILGNDSMVENSVEGPCGITTRFVEMAKGLGTGLTETEIHDLEPSLRKELLEPGSFLKSCVIWGKKGDHHAVSIQ